MQNSFSVLKSSTFSYRLNDVITHESRGLHSGAVIATPEAKGNSATPDLLQRPLPSSVLLVAIHVRNE